MDGDLYEQYLGYVSFGNVSKARCYDSSSQVLEKEWISEEKILKFLPQFISHAF